jgi:hypothetical protein
VSDLAPFVLVVGLIALVGLAVGMLVAGPLERFTAALGSETPEDEAQAEREEGGAETAVETADEETPP